MPMCHKCISSFRFRTTTLYAYLTLMCATCPAHYILCEFIVFIKAYGRVHSKETGNGNFRELLSAWVEHMFNAVSSICAAPFSNMCSTQADNNSRKLRLRCGCQFHWCALALRIGKLGTLLRSTVYIQHIIRNAFICVADGRPRVYLYMFCMKHFSLLMNICPDKQAWIIRNWLLERKDEELFVEIGYRLFSFSIPDENECLASRSGNFTHGEKVRGTLWIGDLIGSRAGTDAAANENISAPAGNRISILQPVAWSLYLLDSTLMLDLTLYFTILKPRKAK
jgi:hypothetical protein